MRPLSQLFLRHICSFNLVVFLVAHGIFAWQHRDLQKDLGILDPPPTRLMREAMAFGDEQFLYRYLAHSLQNAGDTGGRATAMREYNYDYVIGWLRTLQELDDHSQYYPYLGMRYFALTPKVEDVRRIVEFVVEDVERSPSIKWFWLAQAMDRAERTLNDEAYALELSFKLASYDYPEMSSWMWLFPAVLLEKRGRYSEARDVIAQVRRDKLPRLERETLNWMDAFEQELLR